MTERVKTPTVLQMEAVECGAASLAMVLAYYGKFVPLEELRIACGVSRDGSNAAGMMKAARSYGLTTKAFKKEPEGLQQLSFPQIIFWKFNHFMVLEGFTDDGVYANDPDGGRRFIPKEEFDESFTGVTLTFEPGPNFQPGGRRAPVAKQLLKRLRNSRSTLVFLGIAALALIVPAIVVPGSTRVLVDDFFVGQRSDSVQMVLVALLGAVIVTAGLVWLQQFHLLRLQVKLGLRMSTEFFWHVLRLPMGFFSQRSVGDIAWRVSLNEQISQMLAGPISTDVLGLVTAGFFMILMVYLAPLLAGVSLLLVALNVYGARFSQKKRGDLNASLLRELGKIQSVSVQGLITIETLKASGGESDFFVRWSGTLARVLNAREKLRGVEQPLAVLPFFMVTLTTVGVLGVGGLQVLSGDISIGTLIAFQVLLSLFLVPVTGFVEVYGQVEDIRGSLARLQDVLDYELDPEAAHDEGDASRVGKLTGRVELQGITFGYNPNAAPLLQDLSAELRPGGRLAFVGASGSGKSTTARVAAGLYPAWKGSVLFDGTPRHEIPRGVLASSVALVDQSIVLFKGTVRDNITLWDPTIPEHDVIRAARDACIHEDISTRIGGYSGPVEEGGRNFSGGQRQRLEIARALARNPSVLILDEATSALDPLTEMLVDRNLRRRGCTCIVISHRLSTIRDADEIIVLDKGDVVQRGTHDTLKDQDGVYARLIGSDHA